MWDLGVDGIGSGWALVLEAFEPSSSTTKIFVTLIAVILISN
jgi:hypothetical protein